MIAAVDVPTLEMLVRDWIGDTRKSDAYDGGANDHERRMIDLAHTIAPALSGVLHRGQGVPDDVVDDLIRTGSAMLPASMRLICSWTTSIEVARAFALDAAEEGFSAIVMSLPVGILDPLIDVTTLDMDTSEREVIVRNGPLHLTMDHVSAMWRYDDERGVSIPYEAMYDHTECSPQGRHLP